MHKKHRKIFFTMYNSNYVYNDTKKIKLNSQIRNDHDRA